MGLNLGRCLHFAATTDDALRVRQARAYRIGLTSCKKVESYLLLGIQVQLKYYFLAYDALGGRYAVYMGSRDHSVQAFVPKDNAVRPGFEIEQAPGSPATHAADLKQISEIRREINAEGNFERLHPIIYKAQLFVRRSAPEEFRAQQVQRTAMDCH